MRIINLSGLSVGVPVGGSKHLLVDDGYLLITTDGSCFSKGIFPNIVNFT